MVEIYSTLAVRSIVRLPDLLHQIQHEILEKRRAEKKADLEAVKKFRKGCSPSHDAKFYM